MEVTNFEFFPKFWKWVDIVIKGPLMKQGRETYWRHNSRGWSKPKSMRGEDSSNLRTHHSTQALQRAWLVNPSSWWGSRESTPTPMTHTTRVMRAWAFLHKWSWVILIWVVVTSDQRPVLTIHHIWNDSQVGSTQDSTWGSPTTQILRTTQNAQSSTNCMSPPQPKINIQLNSIVFCKIQNFEGLKEREF